MRALVRMGSQSPDRFVVEVVAMKIRLTLCSLLTTATSHSQRKVVEKRERVYAIALIEH